MDLGNAKIKNKIFLSLTQNMKKKIKEKKPYPRRDSNPQSPA